MNNIKHIECEDKANFVQAGLALRIQDVEALRISRQSAHDGGKVVPGTHFY
jgi:hypothetical protein